MSEAASPGSGAGPAHHTTVRVYYEDTDLAGIVYYANYLKYLERGRTEALRAVGVDQRRLKAEHGIVFAVTRIALDYRRPAQFDDLLTVVTRVASVGAATLEMAQSVRRGATTLCEGTVTVACLGQTGPVARKETGGGRPVRLPAAVRTALDRLAARE